MMSKVRALTEMPCYLQDTPSIIRSYSMYYYSCLQAPAEYLQIMAFGVLTRMLAMAALMLKCC
jgi:hypothetical protein